jgi:antitoxin CptB
MTIAMTSAAPDHAPASWPTASPPTPDTDTRALARLRWRCRRGMLENDLILARFLDARGATMTADEIAALERLLELGDNELWDLLSGRAEPTDVALCPLVAALRMA